MKTGKIILISAFSALAIFSGCKKDEDKVEDAKLDANVSQFNSDANNYKAESDQVDNDINNSLSEIPAFGRMSSSSTSSTILSSPLCGVIIDSSQIANKILFYNFDGVTPCFSPSRTRSGQIKVELTSGTHWSDIGAELTLTYIDFKVVRLSNNKSIKFKLCDPLIR